MRTFKLVVGVLFFVVMIIFISFNLDNKVSISFWGSKAVVSDVPVYLVIFSSFVCGVLFTLPFAFFKKVKYLYAVKDEDKKDFQKKKNRKKVAQKEDSPIVGDISSQPKI
ncbi:MAG: DUF1049 domain-containing protein [Spirochaetales bacterium]|nr:DUF1049 domain-containing protein [Spirochaetales bacterium]